MSGGGNVAGHRSCGLIDLAMLLSPLVRSPLLSRREARIAELSPYTTARDGHYDRLNGRDLLTRDPEVSGNARVLLHSGIAADRHRRCQVQHDGGALIQNLVVAS